MGKVDVEVRSLDSTIGRLDRVLSELIVLASSPVDEADRQTLKHHAEDMHGVANKVLELIGEKK